MQYYLSEDEKRRLIASIKSIFAIPYIDDVEDFILEAALCYAKSIPIVDPLTNIRSKKLFDVVDNIHHIGWSVKGLQTNVVPGGEFELVIQRADIFKKANELGFEPLNINTDPQTLGNAVLTHWNRKIIEDSQNQSVTQMRVAILLKSIDRSHYRYIEEDIKIYSGEELYWQWTNEEKVGLQGRRIADNFCVFRWYPNQKQLFERYTLGEDAFSFSITPSRLPIDDIIVELNERLNNL